MPPRYPFPSKILPKLVWSGLSQGNRSFRADALACMDLLEPPLLVEGSQYIPSRGPCLITINHYTSNNFRSWWLTLAVSAVLPAEVHWVITSAWTYPDTFRTQMLTPLTRWAFSKVAHVYGFTNMPPMPPSPDEVAARAQAVRSVLEYVRRNPCPIVGLAPEGGDPPAGQAGVIQQPPNGAGRFIQHLVKHGLVIIPAGLYETERRLCLRFGPAYDIYLPKGLAAQERDRLTSQAVMLRIAQLLPESMRGDFGHRS